MHHEAVITVSPYSFFVCLERFLSPLKVVVTIILVVYICVSVCGFVHMSEIAHGGQKRELEPLELEL